MSERLQRQARALGDATRHRIFAHVAAADHDVDVAELTALLALNHTTVREHLAVLVDAGLLVEEHERQRTRPGRPRLLYRLAPDARGTWDTGSPYEWLAMLLLEILTTGDDPIEVGRRAARRQGLPAGEGDVMAALEDELRRSGFEPRSRPAADGIEFVLARCPVAATAHAGPEIVCDLHRGLVEGMLEGRDDVIVELLAADPATGPCRLRVRRRSMDA